MSRLLLALAASLVLTPTLAAQVTPSAPTPVDVTVNAGLGYGTALGADADRGVISGTIGLGRDRFAVAVHGSYAESLKFLDSPTEHDVVAAVMAGRAWRADRSSVMLVAGPSYTSRVLKGDRLPSEGCGFGGCIGGSGGFERVEREGLGAMVRGVGAVFPIRDLPIGLQLDAGVNVSTAGVSGTAATGLVLRFAQ